MTSALVAAVLGPRRCRRLEPLRDVLHGRTVLITGASSGIGAATARHVARAGAEVVLVARTGSRLDEVAAHIRSAGGRAAVFPADLSRLDTLADLAARVEAAYPRIDVVVHNAGRSIRRRLTESFDRDDLQRSIAVNFSGPAALTMALLPRLLAQGGGHLVSVSTVSALQPGAPRWGTYQSTKAGFDIWLRSLATELRPLGIRATSVYLPLVRTPMSAATPLYRRLPALSAQQAAEVLARAIVRRPDRLAPWWLWWCQLATLTLRTPVDRMLTALDRRVR